MGSAPQPPRDGRLGSQVAAKGADEILGRPVVIGQVPGSEARQVVRLHGMERGGGLDRTMAAGHLPHAIQHSTHLEVRCEMGVRGAG